MITLLLAALALPGASAMPAQAMDLSHHAPPAAADAPRAPAPRVTPDAAAPDGHHRHAPAATSPAAPHTPAPQLPADTATPGGHHHHAPAAPARPVDPSCPPEHAAMGHCTPQGAAPTPLPTPASTPTHAGPHGTALPAGNAPVPAAPAPHYADRIWGAAAMAPARAMLRREHGGMAFSQVMLDLAEVQVRKGEEGFRWQGAFWYGGDINRLTIKTEGEGEFGGAAAGEIQALYSRAIGPYFNLQAGLRQDLSPGRDRTYAVLGVEGLAPYWFDVEGAVFLSDKGDVLARLEGYYDQRITQRLILQPRAELNLSAQDIAASRLGGGLTDAELGLRLRYEIVREFAPYVGVSWERQFGDTARYSRAAGDGTGGISFLAGVRAWF